MQDMLVRLLHLPDITEETKLLASDGIIVRRPIAPEKSLLVSWVGRNFSQFWASEVDVAFSSIPATCYVAQKDGEIIGFSCYNTTAKGFFGPTGVAERARSKGVGKILLIKALAALKASGHVYGIIGGVGPAEYYKKVVQAEIIKGSEDSIYKHLLRKNDQS